MENSTFRIQDISAILKRRKLCLVLPFMTVLTVAALVALLLPPIYKSSSTILIEEQEIPAEFVQTTVTSFVEKRLQEIRQKIMSTTRLQEIIDKYALYEDLKKGKTSEEIIEKMREDIELELISAEVIDQRTGRPTSATIAFTLSYEGKNDPAKVQRVASVLASLYLEENIKVRERQVREASSFFEEEIGKIETSIQKLESELSSYKEKHINSLPEVMQVNIQNLHQMQIDLERVLEQQRGMKEKRASLVAELAATSPEIVEQQHLSNLRIELNKLRTMYSENYPDIIHLKHEIAEIENKQRSGSGTTSGNTGKPTNPAFINLSSQVSSIESEISSIEQQIKLYGNEIVEIEGYIRESPVVEQEYRRLQMERDSFRLKYDDLRQKYMEARVAQGLETEQKGERFTLIDPALLPEKPYKPNRLLILIIGVVLGMGLSVGMTALLEFTDDTIRDERSLRFATRVPVLSVIPVIETARDIAQKKRRRLTAQAAVAMAVIAMPVVVHFFVMDVYVLWAKVVRNIAF